MNLAQEIAFQVGQTATRKTFNIKQNRKVITKMRFVGLVCLVTLVIATARLMSSNKQHISFMMGSVSQEEKIYTHLGLSISANTVYTTPSRTAAMRSDVGESNMSTSGTLTIGLAVVFGTPITVGVPDRVLGGARLRRPRNMKKKHDKQSNQPCQTKNYFENGQATPLTFSSPSNIRTSLRRIASFTFFFVALGAFFVFQAMHDSLQVVFTDILGSTVDDLATVPDTEKDSKTSDSPATSVHKCEAEAAKPTSVVVNKTQHTSEASPVSDASLTISTVDSAEILMCCPWLLDHGKAAPANVPASSKTDGNDVFLDDQSGQADQAADFIDYPEANAGFAVLSYAEACDITSVDDFFPSVDEECQDVDDSATDASVSVDRYANKMDAQATIESPQVLRTSHAVLLAFCDDHELDSVSLDELAMDQGFVFLDVDCMIEVPSVYTGVPIFQLTEEDVTLVQPIEELFQKEQDLIYTSVIKKSLRPVETLEEIHEVVPAIEKYHQEDLISTVDLPVYEEPRVPEFVTELEEGLDLDFICEVSRSLEDITDLVAEKPLIFILQRESPVPCEMPASIETDIGPILDFEEVVDTFGEAHHLIDDGPAELAVLIGEADIGLLVLTELPSENEKCTVQAHDALLFFAEDFAEPNSLVLDDLSFYGEEAFVAAEEPASPSRNNSLLILHDALLGTSISAHAMEDSPAHLEHDVLDPGNEVDGPAHVELSLEGSVGLEEAGILVSPIRVEACEEATTEVESADRIHPLEETKIAIHEDSSCFCQHLVGSSLVVEVAASEPILGNCQVLPLTPSEYNETLPLAEEGRRECYNPCKETITEDASEELNSWVMDEPLIIDTKEVIFTPHEEAAAPLEDETIIFSDEPHCGVPSASDGKEALETTVSVDMIFEFTDLDNDATLILDEDTFFEKILGMDSDPAPVFARDMEDADDDLDFPDSSYYPLLLDEEPPFDVDEDIYLSTDDVPPFPLPQTCSGDDADEHS